MTQSIDEILDGVNKIKVAGQEVELDPRRLEFNEASLSKYLEEEGVWYDYFGQRLAEAEAQLQFMEMRYDTKYSEKFSSHKEDGCSDKLADANSKGDPEVEAAKELVISAKKNVSLLKLHLKAWDKAHDNAQSRGHMIRKEMDKLNADIYYKSTQSDSNLEKQVDDIISKADTD